MSTRYEQALRLIELLKAETKNINEGKEGRPYGVRNAEELLTFFAEYTTANQREVLDKDGVKVVLDAPLTVEGFCVYCGHTERWLDSMIRNIAGKTEAERTADEAELLRSAMCVRDFCRNDLRAGAAQGVYQQNIVARILGLADKQQTTETVRQIVVQSDEEKQDIEDLRNSKV